MEAVIAPALDEQPERQRSEGPLVAAFVVLTLAASAFVIWRDEHDAVHDPTQKAARGEVKGLDKLSLLRPENLRKALAKAGASKWPLVTNVRVAADRVSIVARDTDGNRSVLNIDPAFKLKDSSFGVGDDFAVGVDKIDADAPARIVQTVARRTHLPASAVDYVTIALSESSASTWYMSLKQGPVSTRQWVAAADGSDVRKPGEPSAAQKTEARRQKREQDRIMAQAERRQRQIRLAFERRSRCLKRAKSADSVGRCFERFQP